MRFKPLFLIILLSFSAQSQQIPNLISSWDLTTQPVNGIFSDSISGATGQLKNGATATSSGVALNKSLSQYVQVYNYSSLSALKNNFSIHAKVRSLSDGDWQTVLSHGTGGYLISTRYDGFLFGKQDTGSTQISSSQKVVGDGLWHNIVVTIGPSGQRIYIDGVLGGSNARTTLSLTNVNSLRFGGCANFGEYFNGTIAKVNLYNKELNASEVSQISEVQPTPTQTPVPTPTETPISIPFVFYSDGQVIDSVTPVVTVSSPPYHRFEINLQNSQPQTMELVMSSTMSFVVLEFSSIFDKSAYNLFIDGEFNERVVIGATPTYQMDVQITNPFQNSIKFILDESSGRTAQMGMLEPFSIYNHILDGVTQEQITANSSGFGYIDLP